MSRQELVLLRGELGQMATSQNASLYEEHLDRTFAPRRKQFASQLGGYRISTDRWKDISLSDTTNRPPVFFTLHLTTHPAAHTRVKDTQIRPNSGRLFVGCAVSTIIYIVVGALNEIFHFARPRIFNKIHFWFKIVDYLLGAS